MTNEYGRIIHRNMRVARRFDLRHEGEWPRKRFADFVDFVDNWAARAGLALMVILIVVDVARYGL